MPTVLKKNLTGILILAALLFTTLVIATQTPLKKLLFRPKAAPGSVPQLAFNLNFAPQSVSAAPGTNFSLPVYLNTASASTNGIDVLINYDNTKLTPVSITPDPTTIGSTTLKQFAPANSSGIFTPVIDPTKPTLEFGAVPFNWSTETVLSPFTGVALLANVVFTVKSTATGTATVSLAFSTGSTLDSNIISSATTPTDLLSQVFPATITITTSTNTPTPSPTPSSLFFQAESGTLSGGMVVTTTTTGSYISQPTTPNLNNPQANGLAQYAIPITAAGQYKISTQVNAPSTSSNSFFVNIDSDPIATTDSMIWDISPITSGFQSVDVSWRGNCGTDVKKYYPKTFNLTGGITHQLYIRGREGGTQLDSFQLVPLPLTQPTPTPNACPTATPAPTSTVPTLTPTPTITTLPTVTPTRTPTPVPPTQTPVPPTVTPTPIPPTVTPTRTPTPTLLPPTATPVPPTVTPTHTPTPTPTPIPTSTPVPPTVTPTSQPTATLTPTPAISLATLDFTIQFQGVTLATPINTQYNSTKVVKISYGATTTSVSTSLVAGTVIYRGTLPNLVPGSYTISVKGPAHLSHAFTVNLVAGTNTFDWTQTPLLTGDITNDGIVDISDYAQFATDFDSTTFKASNSDLNFDGKVDISDYPLLLKNYGVGL